MTDILLVDYETSGHHLKYAGGLVKELERQYQEFNITFLTSYADPRVNKYFNNSEVIYTDRTSSKKNIRPGVDNSISIILSRRSRKNLKKTIDHISYSEYDAVHFLHVDNLLQVIWKYSKYIKGIEAEIFASINGAFFGEKTFPGWLNDRFSTILFNILTLGSSGILMKSLPNLFSYRRPWKDAMLYHILREPVFDHLFIPTKSGKKYINGIKNVNNTSVVPDPIILPDNESIDSKNASRNKLGLPTDEDILLFFGELRNEKGVTFLLEALKSYEGKQFTLVFAGEPIDVGVEEIEALRSNPNINLHYKLDYIEEKNVGLYFTACDGVIIPYSPEFGKHRPSNVLNQSCSYGKPIIAPNYGIFSEVVSEWGVGYTYSPLNSDSLLDTINDFLDSKDEFSSDTIQRYAQTQTFEQLAKQIGIKYLE